MMLHPLTLVWRYGLAGGFANALNAALEDGHTVRVELPCGAIVEASTGAAHVVTIDGLRLIRWSEHPGYVDGRHARGEVAQYVTQLVAGRPLPVPGSRMSQPMQDRAWVIQHRAEMAAGRVTVRPSSIGHLSRFERMHGYSAADRTLNSRPRPNVGQAVAGVSL